MVLDTCQACGEEHEPPRGAKCKLVKSKKPTLKSVKMEAAKEAESVVPPAPVPASPLVTQPVEEVTDSMFKLSLDPVKPTKDSDLVAVEPH